MPGTRKAKLVAKETIANVQQPSTRRRDASQASSTEADEGDLMPPPPRQKRKVHHSKTSAGKPLFELLISTRADMQSVAQDWVEVYKNDRDTGLLQMFQLFIQSSGCRGHIDEEMQANMEFAEIIRKMTEEFDEESADYPLIMADRNYKKLRANLADFIRHVIQQCQHSFVYDGYLVDNISSFLTGLTDSQVRAFRHTSTLLTMKLMTALVDVAVSVEQAKENARRQYESEKSKHQSKKAGERLNALQHKKQELDQNHTELLNMLTFIFRGVFVFRYRDVVPDIRSISINELGLWICKLPSLYLEDSYLKYLGWTLYDRVSDVRLTCVKAISSLYELEDGYENKLELFTHRFKDRIVEMTLDKDYEVAIAAVKLILVITKNNSNVMSLRDAENVYELVFSSNRGVAQASADFLNFKMIDGPEGEESDAPSRGKKSGANEQNPNYAKLKTVVQFFHESELHEHATYLVDSLWDINPMLKDWKAMTELLLDESATDEALTQDQESRLIDIMSCCVHQAATGEYPPGRGAAHRKLTGKEQKQARDDKYDMTEHFIEALPTLLSKFGSEKENINHLLKIATHFDLDVYTKSRKEKHLHHLLNMLRDLVEKQSDQSTLQACADVFDYFCNDQYSTFAKVDLAKSSLVDSLITKYKDAWLLCIEEGDSSDEAIYSLYSATKKLHSFSAIHAVHATTIIDIWESVMRTLKKASKVPDEIVVSMISMGANMLLWMLKSMDNKSPDKSELKSLKKKSTSFMKVLQELLLTANAMTLCETFVTVCDLLVVFSPQIAVLYPALEPLVYEANEDLQRQLCSFLTEYIFTADDNDDTTDDNDKIDEMHNKRRRLAAFAKLVTCNIVPINNAIEIFKNYVKFYNDYGDIIKYTLTKCREISKVNTAQTLAMSLAKLYEEVAEDNGGSIDSRNEKFGVIRDLARRFTLTFGLDQVKNREAVAALHKQGIGFALRKQAGDELGVPPNLSFLDVLCEFVNKLIKQDRKVVGMYLDKHMANLPPHRGDEWAPLNNYRALLVNDDDTRSIASTSVSRPRGRRQGARTPANRQAGPLASTAIKARQAPPQEDDVASVSCSMSVLSTGSGQGSDAGGRLGASILSEHGDATLISPSRARPKLTMRLPAPSELLIDGAEGADESDLENFLME